MGDDKRLVEAVLCTLVVVVASLHHGVSVREEVVGVISLVVSSDVPL